MNVIVIVTDSLRADCVGCYGSQVSTPNIDRLAARGTRFSHAYAESLPTIPTRTTWWTGRVQFPFRGWQQLEPSDYPLAEILWDKGYASALVADTLHMHKPVYGFGRGFDNVFWVRGQTGEDPWIVDESIPVDIDTHYRFRGDGHDAFWRAVAEQYERNISMRRSEEDYSVARVVNQAIAWLNDITQQQKDHLFLWVDCFDPHEPWDPPEPYWSMYDPDYDGQELIDPVPGAVDGYLTPQELAHTFALYQGEVTFVDKWIGILLDQIESLGLFENSLIMHVTDHGEPFGEHGIVRKARPFNYTELVHMPWIIYHPEGIGNGITVPAIVQPTDLLPTVLDVLGIAPDLELRFLAPQETGSFPQNAVTATRDIKLHGHSLLPLMAGEIDSVRDYAYVGHHAQSWTIRDQAWSYHLFIDGNRPPELYHVADDWWEQANLIEKHPDRAAHMELELRRFVAGLD